MLRADHVFRRYRRGGLTRLTAQYVQAVDDVSISLAAGERVAIVGESGSGKSSMVRLLLGLEPPDSGEVTFLGRSLRTFRAGDWREFRRAVQVVLQDPFSSLDPRMRVHDIVAEPIRSLTRSTRAEVASAVGRCLDLVGLPDEAARRFPHEFSGGQRQRIAIARALVVSPRLLLLDEPVSALDVSIRAQILNLLLDLHADTGVGFLLISHDLGIVRHIAERVVVMRRGAVVESGAAGVVLSEPADAYTRALLEATPSLRKARSAGGDGLARPLSRASKLTSAGMELTRRPRNSV